MRTILRLLAALMICAPPIVVSAAPAGAAHTGGAPAANAGVTWLDAYFQRLTKSKVFSGAVLIAQNGKVLLARGYGMADWDKHAPNSVSTEFPATGTLTGQFTAAAILRLQEQGKLRVQDSVCSYITPCPKAWRAITIQELLNGSSGIHDYLNDSANTARLAQAITPPGLLALIESYPLDAKPGTQCGATYNGSYPVLGAIVARLTGTSYAAYLQQQFLEPLGLRHTGITPSQPPSPEHAVGYAVWGVPTTLTIDSSTVYAMGDLYSTVGDLQRWNQALLNGQVLSPASLHAMFTTTCTYCPPHCTLDQRAGSMAAAWDIGVLQGRRYRALGGSLPGFQVAEVSYPDQHTTCIVLSNEEDSQFDLILSTMAQHLFG